MKNKDYTLETEAKLMTPLYKHIHFPALVQTFQ